jgi:hypothetical protein
VSGATAVRRRWWVLLAASVALPIALLAFLGHRGDHIARNLLVPGGGLIGEHDVLAALFVLMTIAAVGLWLRWGMDWTVPVVLLAAMAVTAALSSNASAPASVINVVGRRVPISSAAHEFPLVLLFVSAGTWLSSRLARLPPLRWLRQRRPALNGVDDLLRLAVVPRCRAAAIAALVGDGDPSGALGEAVAEPDVARRARRVGMAARGRTGGDPFRVDHAHARAALAVCDRMDAAALDRFAQDADRAPAGVPASEPGWVRPLDGTLAAMALDRRGRGNAAERWQVMLRGPFALRRGHRAGRYWTPLAFPIGRASDWEHATFTGLARQMGWIDDRDWDALRSRLLGAAARGVEHVDDERLIAAGRLWLSFVHDPQAARVLQRPTIAHDPLACALDRLAQQAP